MMVTYVQRVCLPIILPLYRGVLAHTFGICATSNIWHTFWHILAYLAFGLENKNTPLVVNSWKREKKEIDGFILVVIVGGVSHQIIQKFRAASDNPSGTSEVTLFVVGGSTEFLESGIHCGTTSLPGKVHHGS